MECHIASCTLIYSLPMCTSNPVVQSEMVGSALTSQALLQHLMHTACTSTFFQLQIGLCKDHTRSGLGSQNGTCFGSTECTASCHLRLDPNFLQCRTPRRKRPSTVNELFCHHDKAPQYCSICGMEHHMSYHPRSILHLSRCSIRGDNML
jgi:hypothetical protein